MPTSHPSVQNQTVGFSVTNWQGAKKPMPSVLTGRFCWLEPLNTEKHSADLYAAFTHNTDNSLWTYLPYGPFADAHAYTTWLNEKQAAHDTLFYSIMDIKTRKPVGVIAYLRIDPSNGVIEMGHVVFSPLLQRTPMATEALFLLIQQVFDIWGYRRCEWKCDALNAASRRAAERLGFQFEGVFRQARVYKNRNRDTAWFAIIDKDWAALQSAFSAWLSPENFDAQGIQRQRLQDFRM